MEMAKKKPVIKAQNRAHKPAVYALSTPCALRHKIQK